MATRAKKQARKMRAAAAKAPVVEHEMESPQSVEEKFVPVAKPKRRSTPKKTKK